MRVEIAQLFERYHGVVYRRCVALLGNGADAEEAVQEVFTRAISGFGRFRLASSPLTWLYAISTRYCLQLLRNRSVHELKHALLIAPAALPSPDERPELERVFADLSLEELELVALAYRDGLTHDEISEVTRQSRKTVGKKLERLNGKLRLKASALVEAPAVG